MTSLSSFNISFIHPILSYYNHTTHIRSSPLNLYILDDDPTAAAKSLCDRHVARMPLELAQIICTIANQQNINAPYTVDLGHPPCILWAREAESNWQWLLSYADSACKEYTARYHRVHPSQEVVEWAQKIDIGLPPGPITPPPLTVPAKYQGTSTVWSYRSFYARELVTAEAWKKGAHPRWYGRLVPGTKLIKHNAL